MGKFFDYDLIIIGSGAAGSAAAFSAASAGQRVAIIEAQEWGGAALNYRDLPIRAAMTFSETYSSAIRGHRLGLSSSALRFNYPALGSWLLTAKRRSGANSKKPFEDAGITCYHGFAHFLSPYEISVGSDQISASKFVIASGSNLHTNGIIGVESVECLTPRSALSVDRPPKSLLIVGGGSTGCELAEYFSSLGTKVCLTEVASHLLPKQDEEAGSILAEHFEETGNIKVLTQSRVVSVSNTETGIKVTFLRGGVEKFIRVDSVLLATGSRPALDLGLENAGVKFSHDGIKVDDYLQTSVKHIYAAGRCVGFSDSTEQSAYEGALAAGNLCSRQRNLANFEGFAHLVRTLPPIASIGLSEEECLRKNMKYKKAFVPLSSVSASNTSDFRAGFLKLLVNGQGRIVGATVMCPNADLIIGELAIVIRHQLPLISLASTPHISSSWSELVRIAAKNVL